MKRNGYTLIEIVISLAIFSVIVISISSIMTSTIFNIEANGKAINSVNEARTELNIAMDTPSYYGKEGTVTQTETTVDVLGTDVPVRYIESEIIDITGRGVDTDIKLFVYCLPVDNSDNGTSAYIDTNYNGVFDGFDKSVSVDELKRGFTYLGNGNLVLRPITYTFDYDAKIKIKDDVKIENGAVFETSKNLDITCKNFYLLGSSVSADGNILINCDNIFIGTNEGGSSDIKSQIISNNGAINIVAKEDVSVLKNSYVSAFDTVTFVGKTAYLNGTAGNNTKIFSTNGVIFDLDEDGAICLGDRATSTSDTFVIFKGGDYDGYAFNKNGTVYDSINYLDAKINADDDKYFK